MGTFSEIEENGKYLEGFRDRYEDDTPEREIFVGTRRVIAHGDLYREITNNPLFIRLCCIKQLGLHGLISGRGPDYVSDVSAQQNRYRHGLDTAVRMEIALRLNGCDNDMVNLGIASGLLHDIYTPAFSDQGKLANREMFDEEKNIEMILKDKRLKKILQKIGVNPTDVISMVRGEYPTFGKFLNSEELDIDKISYTVVDSENIHPSTVKPEDTHLFEWYRTDPYVRDLHESIYTDNNGKMAFLRAEPVRKLLYLRAWMHKNYYYSPANRAREAFLENELRKLWKKGKLSKKKMLKMNDSDLEHIIRGHVEERMHREFFSLFPDAFCESAKIKYHSVEEILKKYKDSNCIVKILCDCGLKPAEFWLYEAR